jgi:uncharacterized protein DUF6101
MTTTKSKSTFSDRWLECLVHADVAELPSQLHLAIPLRKSLPLFLFSLGWIFASFLLLAETSKEGILETGFGALFVMTGFALLGWSSSRVGARLDVLFKTKNLTLRRSGGFRWTRYWDIPYTSFQGVVMRQSKRSIDDHTWYYQIIELMHQDPDLNVPLYIQKEMGSPRNDLRAYAHRFRLPAFRAESKNIDSVEPFEI